MSFLAPLGFALFGISVPLVILYLLKQKREDRVVSSTWLWEKVVTDLQARHPLQRLRANLLLILQLLALLLLAAALARPAVEATLGPSRAIAVVLDVSASMQARDVAGFATRLDAAKAEARRIFAGMKPSDRAMLVVAGHAVRTAKALTSDRDDL
ncbi:MAG: BatA domain-containing protein, partial [Polyangiaceae bacterium]